MRAFIPALLLTTGLFAAPLAATPLRLEYSVTDLGGGLYHYQFKFINDNNDGTWVAGQTFRWFVFGDAPSGMTSPLLNFVGDTSSFVDSPYTSFGTTGGVHNGPDLQTVLTDWIPTHVGDSFWFSGTSTANLGQGLLAWSNNTGGSSNPGVIGNFEIATLTICQPDIGYHGPGNARLTVCGGDLSPGNNGRLYVLGAPAGTPGFLVADFNLTPFQVAGGTIIGFSGFPLNPDLNGELSLFVRGGRGPVNVYVQYVYIDNSLPLQVGFTNGVRIELKP